MLITIAIPRSCTDKLHIPKFNVLDQLIQKYVCQQCIIFAARNGNSGMGSGSGSGVRAPNSPPTIENCPVSRIVKMVSPEIGQFSVNLSVLLAANDPDADQVTFRTMLNSIVEVVSESSPRVIVNASIKADGSFISLTIDGDVLNPVVVISTEFSVAIVASDGLDISEPCVAMLRIVYLQAAVCQDPEQVRSNLQQATSESTTTQQFFGVQVQLIVDEVIKLVVYSQHYD